MDQKECASGRSAGKAEQPLTENKFGKLSRLSLRTGIRKGKTILEDVAFTAPYKIMNPFSKERWGNFRDAFVCISRDHGRRQAGI